MDYVESKVKPFSVVYTGVLGCRFDSKSLNNALYRMIATKSFWISF